MPSNEQPGFVAAVVNPGGFYIQLAEQEADLAELMTSLAATCNSPDSDKLVLVDPKRGGKCCVRSVTDEQWCRGVIDTMEDDTHDSHVHRDIRDFGTSETVMTEELRYIRPELLRQAPFAIHCCVAGLDNNAKYERSGGQDQLSQYGRGKDMCKTQIFDASEIPRHQTSKSHHEAARENPGWEDPKESRARIG